MENHKKFYITFLVKKKGDLMMMRSPTTPNVQAFFYIEFKER